MINLLCEQGPHPAAMGEETNDTTQEPPRPTGERFAAVVDYFRRLMPEQGYIVQTEQGTVHIGPKGSTFSLVPNQAPPAPPAPGKAGFDFGGIMQNPFLLVGAGILSLYFLTRKK